MTLFIVSGIPAEFVTLGIVVEVKKLKADTGPRVDAATNLSEGKVDLVRGNDGKWYGQVAASPGTTVDFNAAARVNKDGSLKISIMAPGNTTRTETGNTRNGVCQTGPFSYRVKRAS